MNDENKGPWHRGFKSRKQQERFEGRKPRKPVKKGRRRYDEEQERRKAA